MGCGCRETANIFFYLSPKWWFGRNNWKWRGGKRLLKSIARCFKYKEVWGDSFGWIPCLFLGHKYYQVSWDECGEWSCNRCHRYVKRPKWSLGISK